MGQQSNLGSPEDIQNHGISGSEESTQNVVEVPQDLLDQLAAMREAKKNGMSNPVKEQPGLIVMEGFNAPKSEAIKVLLSNIERLRDKFNPSDLSRLEEMPYILSSRNYVTSSALETCRLIKSLNMNYEAKGDLAKQIANELTAVDQMESSFLESSYNDLIASLSAGGNQTLQSELERIHSRIKVYVHDYYYLSENSPDFLIESRETFCSKI